MHPDAEPGSPVPEGSGQGGESHQEVEPSESLSKLSLGESESVSAGQAEEYGSPAHDAVAASMLNSRRRAKERQSLTSIIAACRSGVKLFVGGLSWDTDEEKLKEYFSQYGTVTKAVVLRQRQTCVPRGFGFVTFEYPSAAERVIGAHVIDGRQIEAKPSVPRDRQPGKAKKIFVGGLAPDTTKEMFQQHFEQFGPVAEAQIMVDHATNRSRGFGFITFCAEESAERVFEHGVRHRLGSRDVEVKQATPRGSGPVGGRGAASRGRGPAGRSQNSGRSVGAQAYPVNPYGVFYGMPMGFGSGYAGEQYSYPLMMGPVPTYPPHGGIAYRPYPQPGQPYVQQQQQQQQALAAETASTQAQMHAAAAAYPSPAARYDLERCVDSASGSADPSPQARGAASRRGRKRMAAAVGKQSKA